VNLNDVIEESVQLLSRTIPKVVEIELKLQYDLTPILIDPSQIEQVLINLLINAKDAMPQGGHVTICTSHATLDERYCRTYPEVQPGEYVVLNVSDTGSGMDKDVVDRIFEPFFTMKKPGEGTGLGLAIVFGIVKSHGGYISCRSSPGKGTTFELCFPAMELEIGSNASDASERPVLGTETILLVDDEEPIRNFATEVLSKVGYTVLVAADGREALEIYQKQGSTIDLVVLDLVMPKMGGVQCLEELVKIDPRARVLIVSGHLLDPHTTALIQQRAKGIVKKPLKVADVLRAVRGVLDKG
jgi:CheY-like chemotaxis protein